tara:strand:+ start:1074 stop:1265 length:192 start_codon:yes stop_codon:yes gene_type:complete
MLSKYEILVVIFILLAVFYLVISLSARKKGKSLQSKEITNYLFGVRVLIIIIGLVSLILWLFL